MDTQNGVARSKMARRVSLWVLPVVYSLLTATTSIPRIYNNSEVNSNDSLTSSGQERHLLATEGDCLSPAIDEFPADFLTQEQRLQGGVAFHIIISAFICYSLAIVCDDYFVPSLAGISEALNLPSDVAGATFMAAGTSAPELFTSVVGVFITQGDIGVGTIVGSAVFNILAVVSVCGLLSGMVVPLDWWPLTRDCLAYTITVFALIIVINDSEIQWYESTCLIVMFLLYIVVMYFNSALERFAEGLVNKIRSGCCSPPGSDDEKKPLMDEETRHRTRTYSTVSNVSEGHGGRHSDGGESGTERTSRQNSREHRDEATSSDQFKEIDISGGSEERHPTADFTAVDEEDGDVCSMPHHNPFKQVAWVIMWPATFIFYITIPDCRTDEWKKWYVVTFLVSIAYIGGLSYLVAWMVTIVGYTFGIPDSVMGLTFLAAGTSVPEAISSIIVCKQGFGNMAISNSVGSNVFDILFCLGVPWLIKAIISSKSVHINSSGMEYSVIALLTTVVFMYGSLVVNKFKLDKRVGLCCLIMYAAFLTISSLFETNVFGQVNLPTCDR